MSLLLHNENLAEFNSVFYKDLLTEDHLTGGEIAINKVIYPNGDADDTFNFWGYKFEKGSKKYLVSSKDELGNSIDLLKNLPIVIENEEKVANKEQVYWHMDEVIPAKFTSVKKMNFKQMIQKLSSFKYSNTPHYQLLIMMGFTQASDRFNCRISSPPGSGKDSMVDIYRELVGKCTTIVSPTLAKLEFLATNYSWLAINEVVDVTKTEWRIIEQFLLDVGAFKTEIPKHSRAIAGRVKETIPLLNLSLSLLYNDINCYEQMGN